MFKFYKPVFLYIIIDIILMIIGFYVVLDWFPLTTSTPFQKYKIPSVMYMVTWVVVSYFAMRYKPLKTQKISSAMLKMFFTITLVFLAYWGLIHFFFKPYSGFVLLAITIGAFLTNYLYWSFMFAYKYAVDYNDFIYRISEERLNAVVYPAADLDDETFRNTCGVIREQCGEKVLAFLEEMLNLRSGNTRVYVRSNIENLRLNARYRYSTIVQLERLNHMRAVNETFSLINEKLPDNGRFVCCFESKSTHKKNILRKYPPGLNKIMYLLNYLLKRVIPKIMLINSVYYFFTKGEKRIFSKSEVLGRLYCTGFKVVREKKIDTLTWLVLERVKQPETVQKRVYGPLIRLRRMGKNGKAFTVYKMRTMHPYSEYIQSYIFERNSLQDGGKFKRDIRVTTFGRFMRKYWLDELPMFINLIRGEMKLVGVRPLSAHYFSLYSPELQQKRIKFKPGLLPPFYADMPKTLDEIQESEMRYLNLCEQKGAFVTDINYLFMILHTIFIKKARSA